MLLCPLCHQEASDTQIQGGRCPHCGGIVHWNAAEDDAESKPTIVGSGTKAGTGTDILSGSKTDFSRQRPSDSRLSVYATINPRDLSPEMQKSMDDIWSGTHDSKSSPRMTLKNTSTTIWGGLDLVIPSRRVRSKEDLEMSVRADYELGHVVGEGGVGTVFSARQASINRTVAIKMLKDGLDIDLSNREKFLAEAVVTGELEHPNIVPIYDVGSNSRGQLFYSMKLVHGTPWSNVIEVKSLVENLAILMRVCDAVAFAHDKGVIHRDLKPENVMLGGFGEVLVMDWGIAISTALLEKDESIKKSIGMGGTPAYMAPEMASGPLEAIDRRSDVYLLGAILFEIITGEAPHFGTTVTQCLVAAARNEITRVKHSGELIEIAYKAMSTQRADRYNTVADFQDAIREYQSHSESIALTDRANKELREARESEDYQHFARTMFAYQEAIALWDDNDSAHDGLHAATVAYAETALKKGDFDLGLSLLDPADSRTISLYKSLEAGQLDRDQRQKRFRNVRRMVTGLVVVIFVVVSFFLILVSQQRAQLAGQNAELTTATTTLQQQKQDLEAQKQQLTRTTSKLAQQADALERNKSQLEQQNQDLEHERNLAKQLTIEAREAEAKAVRSKQIAQYRSYLAQIGLAAAKIDENAFADATRILDAYSDSPFKHWEWGRLRYYQKLEADKIEVGLPVDSVAFSPDAQQVAISRRDGIVQIRDLAGGAGPLIINTGGQYVFDIAFSPDGTILATAGDAEDNYLALWNPKTGERLPDRFDRDPHTDWGLSISFSADGQLLLSTSYDKTAKVWSIGTRSILRTMARHHGPVWDGAIAPDKRTIVTGSQDGTAIVWRDPSGNWTQSGAEERILPKFSAHDGAIYAIAIAPDSKTVATAGHDKVIRLWDATAQEPFSFQRALANVGSNSLRQETKQDIVELAGHTAAVRSLVFSASGDQLISGSSDNTIGVWDVGQENLLKFLRGHSDTVSSCDLTTRNDRLQVVSGSFDGTAKVWDVSGYREQQALLTRVLSGHDDAVLSAAFDSTGQRVVTASRDRTARVWDLDGKLRKTQPLVLREGHEYLISTTLFTPDGRRMITAAMDNTIRIWDTRTGVELNFLANTGRRAVADIGAGGTLLLAAGEDNRGRIYDLAAVLAGGNDTANGQIVVNDPRLTTITAGAFTDAQGNSLAFGDEFGRCTLYRRTGDGSFEEAWSSTVHAEMITRMQPIVNSGQLLTASRDGTIRVIDLRDGSEAEARRMVHPGTVDDFSLLPANDRLVSACIDGHLRVWSIETGKLEREVPLLPGGSKSLAANVRRLLSARRWSEETLADRSNVNAAAIRSVLSGRYHPGSADLRVGVIERVAAALGVPPQELRALTPNLVDVDPTGTLALSGSTVEGTVQFWNLENGTPLDKADSRVQIDGANFGAVAAVRFVPSGEAIVVSGGRRAGLWKLADGHRQMLFSPHGAVSRASFSPDGDFVVTGSWDGTAKVWNAATGQAVVRLSGGHSSPVNSATFSPDGSRVLTAGDDGIVRVWDWRMGALLETPVLKHSAAIRAAGWSPDAKQIVTAGDDQTVAIWDATSGRLLHRLEGHRSAVLCLAFSSDGEYLITGSRDKTARVWNLGTGVAVAVARGHTGDVNSVSFSPDGQRAITASSDQTAKLWDAQPPATGESGAADMQEVLTLAGHTDAVTSAVFSPNGDAVLTAGRDGSVILWEAESILPSIYLADDDLIRSSESPTMIVAPQAVFSAPMQNHFAGGILTARIAGAPRSGKLAVGGAAYAGPISAETGLVKLTRAGNGSVAFGTLVGEQSETTVEIELNEAATHQSIEQLLRSLVYALPTSEEVTRDCIVEVTLTLPGMQPVVGRRTVRGQAGLQAEVATR